MEDYQGYDSYLYKLANLCVHEVLEDNKILIQNWEALVSLSGDEQCALFEAAYTYGYCSLATLEPIPDHKSLRCWLTLMMKQVEWWLERQRKDFGRHVWFDSPMAPLCNAIYVASCQKECTENGFNYHSLSFFMVNIFACGLAAAYGLTTKNINWKDA